MRDRTNHEEGGQRKRPRSVRGQLAAPVDKAGGFEARRLRGFRRRNPRRSPATEIAYVTITSPVQLAMPTGSPPFWCTSYLQSRAAPRKRKMHLPDRHAFFARGNRGVASRHAGRRSAPSAPIRQRDAGSHQGRGDQKAQRDDLAHDEPALDHPEDRRGQVKRCEPAGLVGPE